MEMKRSVTSLALAELRSGSFVKILKNLGM